MRKRCVCRVNSNDVFVGEEVMRDAKVTSNFTPTLICVETANPQLA